MCYCTERLTLLLCVSDPEAAVTVTEDVNGWKLPPQPFAETSANARARSMKTPRRLPRRRNPGTSRQSASAIPPTEMCLSIADEKLALLAALIVTTPVTGAPFGVTEVGEKVQVTPSGNPVHPKATAELNPLSGEIVTFTVADEPC